MTFFDPYELTSQNPNHFGYGGLDRDFSNRENEEFIDYISKTGGVNIVVSSWYLDNLDEVVEEIQKMISLLGGKSSIV